jgi:hypothetical protein
MRYTIECTGENITKPKMRYRVFNDLREGDVFKFSKELWLKLRAVDKYNTVNLSDGSLKWFGSNVEVEVYTGELIFSKALFSDKVVVEE